MTLSRIPSLALLLIGSALALVPSLHAGGSNKNGNPFGNGSFFTNTGTFSAIERSSNGFLGVLQIVTSSTNTSTNALANSGIATVYANGQQFVGSSFGTIDPNSGTLAATYAANTARQVVLLPTVSWNITTNGNVATYGLTNFSLSNNISGQFTARLANAYPNQTLSGSGLTTVTIQTASYTTTNPPAGEFQYIYGVTNQLVIYEKSVTGCRLSQ
ncbi:MAG: hypothetical protein K8R38_06285 [Verrucomicrobia bacterium]|nr:hypothetical protein [Verrucomicrobiota bacterium]